MTSCKNIFNNIAANVKRKFLLKDEQFFQGELFLELQPKILELNDECTVSMGHHSKYLSTGKVDIAVLDHRKRERMLVQVVRQTLDCEKDMVHTVMRLATLAGWGRKTDTFGVIVIVGDSRELAELCIPENTTLYRKKKLVDLDKLQITKDVGDNYETYMRNLEKDLGVKRQKGDFIPNNITVEYLGQNSTLKAVRSEDKFSITVWRVKGHFDKTFITELEGD